jgi:Leucine-rich repeat (LRR) protein
MEVFILIFLPIAFMLLADLYEKITTTPEERAKKEADNEIAIALSEAQEIKDQKAWQEKINNEQGWKNDVLDGEYQFMSKQEKHKYLNSAKWQNIRRFIIERDKNCVYCGDKTNLHVHHIHYLRLGRENLSDLVVLCNKCHFKLHEEKGYSRQGLYAPENFAGTVPNIHELKQKSANLVFSLGQFVPAPDKFEKSAPKIFSERILDGNVIIGPPGKEYVIPIKSIETISTISLSGINKVETFHGLHHLHKLKNLKTLQLRDCGLIELPEQIGELIHLEVLDIGGNKLSSLPDFLGNLTNLKRLILPEKELVSDLIYASEDLKGLPFLDDVSKYNIKLLFSQLDDKSSEIPLKKLKISLDVTRKILTPRANIAVVDDSWMERLLAWADENDINEKDLPRDKSGLTNLQELTLFDNKLTELPKEIGQLTQLQSLVLGNTQLTGLPKEIGQLTKLQNLDLTDNQLSKLPKEIGQLTKLQNLNLGGLDGNQLTVLPKEIGQLTNLQNLNLYFNRLTELPKEIGQLTRLGELILSENNLTELPKEIVNLTNLKRLSADKGVRLTREQTNWIVQFNIDIKHE